jgi:hypothetical protein
MVYLCQLGLLSAVKLGTAAINPTKKTLAAKLNCAEVSLFELWFATLHHLQLCLFAVHLSVRAKARQQPLAANCGGVPRQASSCTHVTSTEAPEHRGKSTPSPTSGSPAVHVDLTVDYVAPAGDSYSKLLAVPPVADHVASATEVGLAPRSPVGQPQQPATTAVLDMPLPPLDDLIRASESAAPHPVEDEVDFDGFPSSTDDGMPEAGFLVSIGW